MSPMRDIRVFGRRVRLMALAALTAALALGFSDAAPAAASNSTDTALAGRDAARESAAGEKKTTRDKRTTTETSGFDVDAWGDVAARIGDDVLQLALNASQCAIASGAVERPSTLTVIDYSRASVEPRLWVLDLETRALLYEELVSHGQGSGGNYATRFSNQPDSHQTSIGLFVTDTTYVGRNGYSLRLDGLDKGFNDRARARSIVMHGAPYVNSSITKALGRLGRSHGCPAVRDAVARELIDRIKGGNLVFSYYPDDEWLKQSAFLGKCASRSAD